MAALGAGVACLPAGSPSTALKRVVLGAAGVVAVLVLAVAFGLASRVWRRVSGQVEALRSMVARNEGEVRSLAERVLAGERFAPADTGAVRPRNGDPFTALAADLERARLTAGNAVVTVAARGAGSADHRLEVFVNIARRMQSMVHREIGVLDELESQVEDPDLLKGLFRVDHLATRMLREAESLSVLGGALPQRRWSAPVSVYEVVRAAVAETEYYSRVKVIPPVEGTLAGNAVADVIHLLAELVENATKFSPEDVTVRVTRVSAGIAVDVDDRGLGMDAAQSQQMNALLDDPGRVNVGELLRDGRIGLFVVSTLARRQGVTVRLQGNLYGGTQASVVIPDVLVDPQEADAETPQVSPSRPVPPPRPAPPQGRHAAAPAELPHRRSDFPEPSPGTDGGWGPPPPSTARPEAGAQVPGPPGAGAQGPGPQGAGARGFAAATPVSGAPGFGTGAQVPGPQPPGTQVPGTQELGTQGPDSGVSDADRPPLPIRPVQQSLAAPLREGPPPPAGHADQYSEHSPNLMASFQSGFGRSEQDGRQNRPEGQQATRHGQQHEEQQDRSASDSAD
jgi:signal transduction histidine kinase